jgi:hypothetical protein
MPQIDSSRDQSTSDVTGLGATRGHLRRLLCWRPIQAVSRHHVIGIGG